ncbi:dephospho-CoA kinase-like [Solanum stenotomum]|uniref:dephospho-CoA kinase-like n=1 Tax=Solanum stenotomum TaxID=172797 RepID=UPI0020D1C9A5|nr:dephospho-CoA kinase-like [Solanum stenotomum]
MSIVGLTGGIASGKSTVSNFFKAHGIPVVDTDVVARNVLKKGTGGWKKVVAAFGEDILLDNGEVDRAKLGQIVFSDLEKLQLLNRLLAPFISHGMLMKVLKLWIKGCSIIVVDVPLLFDAKVDKWTKPIVVIWVDPETQLQRLMTRDGSMEEAKSRINAQMSLDLKRSKADIVNDNTSSLEALHEQFQKVLTQITKPLTWTEFMLSRNGAFLALFSTFANMVNLLMSVSTTSCDRSSLTAKDVAICDGCSIPDGITVLVQSISLLFFFTGKDRTKSVFS